METSGSFVYVFFFLWNLRKQFQNKLIFINI